MRPRGDNAALANQAPFSRKSVRAQVVPTEIRGIATLSESGEHLPFLVWDVSPEGMGLWLSQPVQPGTMVKIAVGQPYLVVLDAEIVWAEQSPESNGFRCGIRVDGKREALVGLYEKFGG